MNILKKGLAVLSAVALLTSGNYTFPQLIDNVNQQMTAYAVESTQIWDGSADTAWYDSQETELHITTAEELAGLAAIVNGGKSMAGQTIVLDNDLYLNSMTDIDEWDTNPPKNVWKSIGNNKNNFSGTFDGNNHTIYGLYSSEKSVSTTYTSREGGLFGSVKNGIIQNLSLSSTYIVNVSSALCAVNTGGTIKNCSVDAIVTGKMRDYGGICGKNDSGIITGCTNLGSICIEGSGYIGGICGYSTNSVTDSENDADISVNSNECNIGGVIGYGSGTNLHNTGNISVVLSYAQYSHYNVYCGGIVGYANDEMISCINDGTITKNGYDVYSVSYAISCGGIAGYGGIADFIKCGNNGKITGFNCCGGISGCINAENFLNAYISYSYCYNKDDITAVEMSGGLVGCIEDYYAPKKLEIESSYNTGIITALYGYSGGIMGNNKPSSSNSYVFCSCKNSYSSAELVSGTCSGGIAGKLDYSIVENCYYLNSGATKGVGDRNDDVGITKSAVNMKKPAFAESLGSAFIYTENEYPRLFWENDLELIILNETSHKFTEYKKQFTLTAETLSEEKIQWSSSDEKVATVDQNGVITALGNGLCSITASIGESKAVCNVSVNYDYYIEESGFRLDVDKGKTITVFSKNTEKPIRDVEVVFTSDNEKVATVNEFGIVSANTAGIANIHINVGDVELVCKVIVVGVVGDVNEDGVFNITDVVLLQKWLLGVPNTELGNWSAADLCEDYVLDVFDLCLMKQLLVNNWNI